MRVAVVGGGIAGLAAAWELMDRAEVTVFEPGCLGGAIRTSEFCGHDIDEGPDSFVTRSPEAIDLCAEAGVGADLVAPVAGRSMLWWEGRLRPLPDGLVLGAPRRLGGLAGGGILSAAGVARAGADLVLPRRRPPDGLSVRELVADRFGAQVADRLVDPLVGGIHAGRTEQLGAAEVVPQLVEAARSSRSLLLGLRRLGAGAGGGPMFLAPRAGLGSLVAAVVAALRTGGVAFATTAATAVRPAAVRPGAVRPAAVRPAAVRPGAVRPGAVRPGAVRPGAVRPGAVRPGAVRPGAVRAAGVRRPPSSAVEVAPHPETFDAAVVATPASQAARLLGGPAGEGLAGVESASVAVVTMAFDGGVVPPPGVNGFLVPRGQGRLMTACSFGSRKWPHWAAPGIEVVRLSAGRAGDDPATGHQALDDDVLTGRLAEELAAALGADLPSPVAVRVSRWPDSFPQYPPGHLRRIEAVEDALAKSAPAVVLAGSAYRGAGIPACIASGRRAARLALGRAGPP